MAQQIQPSVFLVAATAIDTSGLQAYLQHIKAPNWTTDSKNDHEVLTEIAGKSCYMSFDTSLNQNLTRVGARNNEDYIQDGLIATRHGSVLEHSSVSFIITDVTRVVTHELIRHSTGTAISQLSGRYVSTDELYYFLPKHIADNAFARGLFVNEFQHQENTARRLRQLLVNENTSFAVKKQVTSAIRRIIGNGATNQIMFTGNHRAWRNIIEQRVNEHAEEEIRITIAEVARQLQFMYPAIYADMTIVLDEHGLPTATFKHTKV